ncbi:hypothetical protein D3C81_714920 [compost metagenome]
MKKCKKLADHPDEIRKIPKVEEMQIIPVSRCSRMTGIIVLLGNDRLGTPPLIRLSKENKVFS